MQVYQFHSSRALAVFRMCESGFPCAADIVSYVNHTFSNFEATLGSFLYHVGAYYPIFTHYSALVAVSLCELLRLSNTDAVHRSRLGILNLSIILQVMDDDEKAGNMKCLYVFFFIEIRGINILKESYKNFQINENSNFLHIFKLQIQHCRFHIEMVRQSLAALNTKMLDRYRFRTSVPGTPMVQSIKIKSYDSLGK